MLYNHETFSSEVASAIRRLKKEDSNIYNVLNVETENNKFQQDASYIMALMKLDKPIYILFGTTFRNDFKKLIKTRRKETNYKLEFAEIIKNLIDNDYLIELNRCEIDNDCIIFKNTSCIKEILVNIINYQFVMHSLHTMRKIFNFREEIKKEYGLEFESADDNIAKIFEDNRSSNPEFIKKLLNLATKLGEMVRLKCCNVCKVFDNMLAKIDSFDFDNYKTVSLISDEFNYIKLMDQVNILIINTKKIKEKLYGKEI